MLLARFRDTPFCCLQGTTPHGVSSLLMGCDGMVPALGPLFPEIFTGAYQAGRAGDLELAWKYNELIRETSKILTTSANATTVAKFAISTLGMTGKRIIAPQDEVTPDEEQRIIKQIGVVRELSDEQWDRVVDTNFKAAYYGSAIAARYMKKQGGGVIMNTSSFTALVPTAGKALYSATKAAVESLTRTLSIELAVWNIRVVSVIPGYIRTEFTAANIAKNHDMLVSSIGMKRLGNPEDLVGAYLFLSSDAASYISGISLPVAGAKLCAQNPLWSWERRAGKVEEWST